MKEYTYDEIWEVIRELVELKSGNIKEMSINKIIDCLNYCAFIELQREMILKTIHTNDSKVGYEIIKGWFK